MWRVARTAINVLVVMAGASVPVPGAAADNKPAIEVRSSAARFVTNDANAAAKIRVVQNVAGIELKPILLKRGTDFETADFSLSYEAAKKTGGVGTITVSVPLAAVP